MLFSRDWLAQYVDLPADAEELARTLTGAGLAVEKVEKTADGGDILFDVEVTTNRVDAMCHLGIAREIAVLTDAALRLPEAEPPEAAEPAAEAVRVTIEAGELCARYAARVVRGVRVGPSPDWLARRLRAIGLRPINNVVDVTNFVLWESGQPLHGFDLAKIAGGDLPEIRVRTARPGESVTTLDGEERELAPGMLVVADAERPVALAGVMGGLDSEVDEGTTDVLIESAWFDPRSVRDTAKRLGMHTDASHRFERGADPAAQARAASRAAALIAEIAGGEILAGVIDAASPRLAALSAPRTIALDLDRLDAFGGVRVPAERAIAWLRGLGFTVAEAAPRRLAVTVPTWRLFDVEETADLYEEVLRVHGLDDVPATLPAIAEPDAPPTARQTLRRTLRRTLAGCGYAEAIDFAFHSPAETERFPPLGPDAPAVVLANPLSELYSVMRRSLLPGLLAAARYNTRRGAESVRLFEIGVTFGGAAHDGSGEGGTGTGVREHEGVALVSGGALGTPWEGGQELDLFALKGAVEALAERAGKTVAARPPEGPLAGLAAGASAELWIDGRRAGVLGRVAGGDDPFPLFVAEVALDALQADAAELHAARTLVSPPRLPGIAADLTLTHARSVAWAELERAIDEHAPAVLAGVRLENRYTGEGVPPGAVNTTIHFEYHGGERQLTQDEVNREHAALGDALAERFGWRRGEEAR